MFYKDSLKYDQVSTSGYKKAGAEITVCKCSEPPQKLADIQKVLEIKFSPFTKFKSVVHKPKIKKLISSNSGLLGLVVKQCG